MQAKLKDLVEESQKVGLRVDIAKTKDLHGNSRTTKAFKNRDEAIECVMTSCTWDPRLTRMEEHSWTSSMQRINKATDILQVVQN
jgi:hypothetical protein